MLYYVIYVLILYFIQATYRVSGEERELALELGGV
jgi:hypothetical protein